MTPNLLSNNSKPSHSLTYLTSIIFHTHSLQIYYQILLAKMFYLTMYDTNKKDNYFHYIYKDIAKVCNGYAFHIQYILFAFLLTVLRDFQYRKIMLLSKNELIKY